MLIYNQLVPFIFSKQWNFYANGEVKRNSSKKLHVLVTLSALQLLLYL